MEPLIHPTSIYYTLAAGQVCCWLWAITDSAYCLALGLASRRGMGLESRCSDPDPVSFPSITGRSSVPGHLSTISLQKPLLAPTYPTEHPGRGGWVRGRHAEPRLRAHPCPPRTQAAWFMGRSTLKAVAGSPPTAPVPPACVMRVSSPVPASSVSPPVPSLTWGPVTAALHALVLGAWGGGAWAGRQCPVSISLPLPWAGRQRCVVPGEVAPILMHTPFSEAGGPGIAASLKAP